MRKTVGMAKDAGIAIGAHPGYPDLQGFGRRDMHLSPDEAYSYMLYQIGALQAFCSAQGVQLAHVKPHGQLYNHAAIDSELAAALAQAVRDVDPKLVLVGLANSALVDEGRKLGLVTAVLSVTGKLVDLHPDTLCVHGDSPSALAFVSRIRQELEQDDIAIKAVGAE